MLNSKEFDNYPDAAEFVTELIDKGFIRTKSMALYGEGVKMFMGSETHTGFLVEWVE